jgi:hypothetical protein
MTQKKHKIITDLFQRESRNINVLSVLLNELTAPLG